MLGVPIRRGEDTQRHGDNQPWVAEAEVRGTRPQTQELQGWPATPEAGRETRNTLSPDLSEEAHPADILI